MAKPKTDPIPRFWAKVEKSENCWLWTGGRLGQMGYGGFNPRRDFKTSAHRFSWSIHNGPIPAGASVLHRCDNPLCVRPDHLFLGTQADNMADMRAKGREAPTTKTANVGVKNGRAILTEAMVLAIRAETGSHCAVGRKYGVAPTVIAHIRFKRTWAHLPGEVSRWRDGRAERWEAIVRPGRKNFVTKGARKK